MRTSVLLATLLPCAACAPGAAPPAVDPPPGPTAPPSCVTPQLHAPYTREGAAAVRVGLRRAPQAGAAGRFELRPVVVDGTGRGDLLLRLDAPFLAFDADGAPLELPLVVPSSALPLPLLLGADVHGAGALVAEPLHVPAQRDCPAASLALATHELHDLAARGLGRAPHAHFVDLFRDDEVVEVAVDPSVFDDRVGLPFDLYVVRHRSPEAWAADPRLRNVAGAIDRTHVRADLARGVIPAWSSSPDAGDGHPAAYDVVLDFGLDGRLDPGDLVDGFGPRPGFWVAGDLSRSGPFEPVVTTVGREPDIQVELWAPKALPEGHPRVPLVTISHGNGHDLRWYGHLGRHLASWGFVVASHRTATAAGILSASTSTLEATDWLLEHRDHLLGGALGRMLDPSRIAWIGHSRGGEGVVRAYQRLLGNAEPSPVSAFTAADVRALVAIAPTVFDGVRRSNPGGAPFLLLAGGADGDVTGGVDCSLCQYLRIPAAAAGPVATIYVHGASHNVFHDGGPRIVDDGVGPDRVHQDLVHPAEKAWLLAWLGWRVLGLDAYREVFLRMPSDFRPRGVDDRLGLATTWREALGGDVEVVDDFQGTTDVDLTSTGLPVTRAGALEVVEGRLDDRDAMLTWSDRDAMNGMTLVDLDGHERGAVLTWSGEAAWSVTLPEPRDVRRWRDLSLAVAQVSRHPFTVALDGPLTFGVALTDADGRTVLVPTAAFGTVSSPYRRGGLGHGLGWSNEWNTVRVPLRAFAAGDGIDLSRVVAISLRFGGALGADEGRVGLDDLALAP